AASGRGADARADRQRNPGDLSFVQLALAGVDADPHLDPDGADRVQDGLRAADRARGTVERREEPVPGRVAFLAAEPRHLVSDHGVVSCEHVAHARSPSSRARSLDPTMSVNITVVRTLSGTVGATSPATSRSSSSTMSNDRNTPQ